MDTDRKHKPTWPTAANVTHNGRGSPTSRDKTGTSKSSAGLGCCLQSLRNYINSCFRFFSCLMGNWVLFQASHVVILYKRLPHCVTHHYLDYERTCIRRFWPNVGEFNQYDGSTPVPVPEDRGDSKGLLDISISLTQNVMCIKLK